MLLYLPFFGSCIVEHYMFLCLPFLTYRRRRSKVEEWAFWCRKTLPSQQQPNVWAHISPSRAAGGCVRLRWSFLPVWWCTSDPSHIHPSLCGLSGRCLELLFAPEVWGSVCVWSVKCFSSWREGFVCCCAFSEVGSHVHHVPAGERQFFATTTTSLLNVATHQAVMTLNFSTMAVFGYTMDFLMMVAR